MDATSSSQDVHHSRVLNAILAPIRDLNENWKVDLSTHLEQYLREICEQQQGLGSVNFVEAALLIQRSTGIYVKKVDYLWNLLMQVLESLRKKGGSGEKGNERRKKSGNISDLYQDFVDIVVTPDKKTWKERQTPIKLDPPYYPELEYNCPREKKLSLFDHMFEPVGDKSDFRLNYPISDTFMLEEELSYSNTLNEDCENMETADCDAGSHVSADNDCAHGTDVGDVTMNADDNLDAEPEVCPEPRIEDRRVAHATPGDVIATVSRSANNRSVDVWDSEAGSIPERTVKVQERIKMPSDSEKKKKPDLDSSVSSLVTDNISVSFGNRFEEFPKFRNEFMKEKNSKKKVVKELQKAEEVEEYRKTLASDFPVDFLGFEDLDISSGEDDEFVGYPDDFDQEDPLPADPDEANANPDGNAADSVPFPSVDVAETEEWGQIYQNILQEKMHSARVGHQDAQAALATRVNQWHDSIRTKLKGAEDRKCMDIHEYETRILNTFPKQNGETVKTTIDFAEVVKDVEDEEICRYFLASLLLANNMNVEIGASDQRELAMNCMQLTLLKSTRHHESLEEYQAPSQVENQNQNQNRR